MVQLNSLLSTTILAKLQKKGVCWPYKYRYHNYINEAYPYCKEMPVYTMN